MKIHIVALLGISVVACIPKGLESGSSEQVLRSQYGRKKIYLWNKPIQNSDDKITRSCWYYKEVPPSAAKSVDEDLQTSVRLNNYAIHDDHVQKQMENILKEKLINAGADFVPCGIATVSVGAALASFGIYGVAFGVSAAWMANNCIKNSFSIHKNFSDWRGAADGLVSLKGNETEPGKIFDASKSETDMYREAIKRSMQLGMEDQDRCPPSNLAYTK